MKRKNNGYLIAVPDKKNPEIINYYHVNGPRFLYGKSIVEDFEEPEEVIEETVPEPEINEDEDEALREEIAKEVKKILNKKNQTKSTESKNNSQTKSEQSKSVIKSKEKTKKKISKPKTKKKTKNYRYTAPKERGVVARIINRMKYEHEWYEDVEDYLYDNYYVHEELEESRTAEKRRDQRLYKRVQAYEDARDDITMKKAFIGMKITAVATLLAATGFSANLLVNQVNDIVNNSGYVSQEREKPTLANANEGQIQYAENVLSKIEYEFKYLSHTELLDTVIRSSSGASKITENKARGACKDFLNFSDQKLLETILEEAYEDDYSGFSEEKKVELKQLVYEMIDENARVWIRSPIKVAELNAKKAAEDMENAEMEID